MNILHFASDSIFLDGVVSVWNKVADCKNRYIIVENPSIRKCGFKYVHQGCVEILSLYEVKKILYDNVKLYDIVILHNLYVLPFAVIKTIPSDKSVVWFSWGFDIYENAYPAKPLIKVDHLLGVKTSKLNFEIQKKLRNKFRNILLKLYARLWKFESYTKFKSAIHRIDYYSGVIPAEYDALCKCEFFRAEKLIYNYISVPSVFEEEEIFTYKKEETAKDILVGNSGSYTNNHLEIFEFLSKCDLKDRRIISPLSYGDRHYIKEIVAGGYNFFGNNFVPLKNFMPICEYKQYLSSCSIAIYAHERQQALGNIYLSLWEGRKVYLSARSLVFNYLKELGLKLYSIQDELNERSLDEKLSYEEIINNRKIIAMNFSLQAVIKKSEMILSKITNSKILK